MRKIFFVLLAITALTGCSKYDLGNTTLTENEKKRVIEILKENDYINCMPTIGKDDKLDKEMNSICSKHKELENIGIKVIW